MQTQRLSLLPASVPPFDVIVAIRLARMVDAYPEHFGLLTKFVKSQVEQHAQALVDIAQQGERAMSRALLDCVSHITDVDTLRTVFEALPIRTVQLRELAIVVAAKAATSVEPLPTSPHSVLLHSQHGARLREGGHPSEGFSLLDELVRTEAFARAPSLIKAHVLCNLGSCLGDLGRAPESLRAHRDAIAFLRRNEPEQMSSETAHLLAGELANAAASAMRQSAHADAGAFLEEAADLARTIDDMGLKLRIELLQLTHMAETDKLEAALALGVTLRERVADLEELESQAHMPAMVDVFINVGSVLLDLNQPYQALDYLRIAVAMADTIAADAPSPQSELKRLIARVAMLNARLLLGETGLHMQARAILCDAGPLAAAHPTAYVTEVRCRVLEIVVQTATADPAEMPIRAEVAEMLASSGLGTQPFGDTDVDRMILASHSAAMAYDKLDESLLALGCARQAVELAKTRLTSETMHQRAHRAILMDSLSRRLYAIGSDEAGLEAAQEAVRLIVPCWRHREAYRSWLESLLSRLYILCEESQKKRQFEQLMSELELDADTEDDPL